MNRARSEAQRLGHHSVRPEHFLLGIAECEGMGAQTLLNMGVDPKRVRVEMLCLLGKENRPAGTTPAESEEAREVIECAKRIARSWPCDWVGADHLFLALIEEQNPLVAQCLLKFKIDFKAAEAATLMHPQNQHPPSPAPGLFGRLASLFRPRG